MKARVEAYPLQIQVDQPILTKCHAEYLLLVKNNHHAFFCHERVIWVEANRSTQRNDLVTVVSIVSVVLGRNRSLAVWQRLVVSLLTVSPSLFFALSHCFADLILFALLDQKYKNMKHISHFFIISPISIIGNNVGIPGSRE